MHHGIQGENNFPRGSYLYYLSQGPLTKVKSYNVCVVNGYKFHTDSYGKSKSTINSGVCIRGSNYSYDEDDFYGILKEVMEVEYRAFPIKKVVLFNCLWYNPTPPPRGGTIVHPKYKIVEVNIQKEYPKYDPFVLAKQASQVYFVPFPSKKKDKANWRAVFKVRVKNFDASYAATKEADEGTTFQKDEVEVHENSDDVQLVDPSRCDPNGAMIPILREVADEDEDEDDEENEDDVEEEEDEEEEEEEEEDNYEIEDENNNDDG